MDIGGKFHMNSPSLSHYFPLEKTQQGTFKSHKLDSIGYMVYNGHYKVMSNILNFPLEKPMGAFCFISFCRSTTSNSSSACRASRSASRSSPPGAVNAAGGPKPSRSHPEKCGIFPRKNGGFTWENDKHVGFT